MWSTPLAQKGFLRICAQTRRDLSLVYNNPQWRIQGRDRGKEGTGEGTGSRNRTGPRKGPGLVGAPFTFRPK